MEKKFEIFNILGINIINVETPKVLWVGKAPEKILGSKVITQ
jgi:hypothetical protein